MDLQQTKEWAEYLKRIGWKVEKQGGVYVYIRKIPLTPVSMLKVQRVEPEIIDWQWVRKLQKKYRVIASYLELDKPTEPVGYHKTWKGMLPTKTQVIDLDQTEEAFLKQMKPKTRYNIQVATRHKLAVKISQKLDQETEKLLMGNSWRVGMFGMNQVWLKAELEAFGNQAFIIKIRDKELLAVAVYLIAGDIVYYMQNGSTVAGRKLMAPTLAVWEGIKEAQRRSLKFFDFDGVSDERHPTKRWLGFTRFKEGFGGKSVYYPQALVNYRWVF